MAPRNQQIGISDPLDPESDPVELQNDPLDEFSEYSPDEGYPTAHRQVDPQAALATLARNLSAAKMGPGAVDVLELRKRFRLTQRQFAEIFGFPVATLRHWEVGDRQPSGTALVLLHVIRENPRAVIRAVRRARAAAKRTTWPPSR